MQADVEIGVQLLLAWKLDVAADRQPAGFARAAVGRLHQPGSAAGDHGEAGAARRAPSSRASCVVGVIGGRARRAEHGHRRADVGERVKSAGKLARDVADALGIGGAHAGRLVAEPQQQLLVERRRVLGRASLARSPSRGSVVVVGAARSGAAPGAAPPVRWPRCRTTARARSPTPFAARRARAACA